MNKRIKLFFGGGLVLIGVLLIIATIFKVDTGAYCWPVLLILIGVMMIAWPRLVGSRGNLHLVLIGDVFRRGAWQPTNEEILLFVGDMKLDLKDIILPPGETIIRVYGFVADIDLFTTPEFPLKVLTNTFVTSSKVFGSKADHVLTGFEYTSSGYEAATSKLKVETYLFVCDVALKQA